MSASQLLGKPKVDTFNLKCNPGAHITRFDGTLNKWLFSIGATCSDSVRLGPVGKQQTTPWSIASATGFSGWDSARFGDATDGITFLNTSGTVLSPIGGTGGALAPKWVCPNGTKIVGISGSHDTYGISTQFTCSAPLRSISYGIVPPVQELVPDGSTEILPAPTQNQVTAPIPIYRTQVLTDAPIPASVVTTEQPNTAYDPQKTYEIVNRTQVSEKPNTEEKPDTEKPKEPKPKTWIWILVFVFIIILAIVGVAVYFVVRPKPESS